MPKKTREIGVKINARVFQLTMARKKLTGTALAEAVSTTTIAKCRHGGRVRLDTAGAVAEALGIDVAELIVLED